MNSTEPTRGSASELKQMFGGIDLLEVNKVANQVTLAIKNLSGSTEEAIEAMRAAAHAMDAAKRPFYRPDHRTRATLDGLGENEGPRAWRGVRVNWNVGRRPWRHYDAEWTMP